MSQIIRDLAHDAQAVKAAFLAAPTISPFRPEILACTGLSWILLMSFELKLEFKVFTSRASVPTVHTAGVISWCEGATAAPQEMTSRVLKRSATSSTMPAMR